MRYAPLPEPTIIDGRRMYTTGDMRAFVGACDRLNHPEDHEDLAVRPSDVKSVDDLLNIFGMK